jgi:hypothetical protein
MEEYANMIEAQQGREIEEFGAELQEVLLELEDARPRAEEAERVFEEAYGAEMDELLRYARRRKHRWVGLWTPPKEAAESVPSLRDEMLDFLYYRSEEARAMHEAGGRVRNLEMDERRLKRKIQKAKREARKARHAEER